MKRKSLGNPMAFFQSLHLAPIMVEMGYLNISRFTGGLCLPGKYLFYVSSLSSYHQVFNMYIIWVESVLAVPVNLV